MTRTVDRKCSRMLWLSSDMERMRRPVTTGLLGTGNNQRWRYCKSDIMEECYRPTGTDDQHCMNYNCNSKLMVTTTPEKIDFIPSKKVKLDLSLRDVWFCTNWVHANSDKRECYVFGWIMNYLLSWGAGWGDGGYFNIARGKNMCGIAKWPAYPELWFFNVCFNQDKLNDNATTRQYSFSDVFHFFPLKILLARIPPSLNRY